MRLVPENRLISEDLAKLNLIRSKYVGRMINFSVYPPMHLFSLANDSTEFLVTNNLLSLDGWVFVVQAHYCWSMDDDRFGTALEILVGERKFFVISWNDFQHCNFLGESNADCS